MQKLFALIVLIVTAAVSFSAQAKVTRSCDFGVRAWAYLGCANMSADGCLSHKVIYAGRKTGTMQSTANTVYLARVKARNKVRDLANDGSPLVVPPVSSVQANSVRKYMLQVETSGDTGCRIDKVVYVESYKMPLK